MAFIKGQRKSDSRIRRYNCTWPPTMDPIALELDMIQFGGSWINSKDEPCGNGMYFHMRRFQELIWPEFIWENGPFKNYWAERILESWINSKYLGIMGCAAASKSTSLGVIALTDWYAFPHCTTTLVSSTELKMLELRIWGYIKTYHKLAKRKRSWIPGHLIEGKQMIIQDSRTEFVEGREFKNGLQGVACKKGNQWVGLSSYLGIHNKRVRLIADEAQLCPRSFLDSTSNLTKGCEDFKLVAPGNPNETTNAHGTVCEPSEELGGWEGGIDQSPGTKTWKTRYPNGLCLQLPGSDSPNLKASENEPIPFPFLPTRQQMAEDAKIWGVDDWHYTMMVEARMPRGQGSHRILTRQECEKFGATLEPFWRDNDIRKIGSLDAAYRGTGGDRCVFTEINWGREIDSTEPLSTPEQLSTRKDNAPQGRQIIALVDQIVVPIDASDRAQTPEEQIVAFCMRECEVRGIAPENFFYDSGMRTSLVQEFSQTWSVNVQSVDCGSEPTEQRVSAEIDISCKDYYKKLVTELWFSIRLMVISRQFRNMSNEVMWELSSREWKKSTGNRIEVETKDEMKIKTGKSPDLADSLALACWGARKRGFVISKMLPPKKTKPGNDWRRKIKEKARKIWMSGQLEYAEAS